MKPVLLLFLFAALSPAAVFAQLTTSDSLKQMYQQYFEIMEQNRRLQDSLERVRRGLGDVSSKVSNLSNDLTGSLQQVNTLTREDILTKESRLRLKKDRILATAVFVKSANNAFDALDAALAQSDYLNDVGQLNSPTNKELGFALSDEVTKLVQDKIIKADEKFNNKEPDKFIAFCKTLIENPISTSLGQAIPAVGAINAVVDLVSSVAVREQKVKVEDFQEFKSGLTRYINHYERLAKASYDFNTNLDGLRVRLDGLRGLLNEFTVERIRTIHPEAGSTVAGPNLNDLIEQYYQPVNLNPHMESILVTHKNSRGVLDYQKALEDPRLDYPIFGINQAQFIQQELEAIATEYVASYDIYHKRLLEILVQSKELSREPAKVDVKKADLDEKLKRLIETFRRNVKIKEVNRDLRAIPAY